MSYSLGTSQTTEQSAQVAESAQVAVPSTTRNPWKWATVGLGGLVVLQFWWWNKEAPQVFGLGSGRRPYAGSASRVQY